MTHWASPDIWKSLQRDWLVSRLRELVAKWRDESNSNDAEFVVDAAADSVAKSRTGGCAAELNALLDEMK